MEGIKAGIDVGLKLSVTPRRSSAKVQAPEVQLGGTSSFSGLITGSTDRKKKQMWAALHIPGRLLLTSVTVCSMYEAEALRSKLHSFS